MRTMILPDGRTLAYAEYGDPAGDPVIFHHGFMCTHEQIGLADASAKRFGFRIIAPHRPGTAGSSIDPRFTPFSVADDAFALADGLGIGSFCCGGTSGGAPFSMAMAVRDPSRIRAAVVMSGMGPLGHPKAIKRVRRPKRWMHVAFRRFPSLSRLFIKHAITEVTEFSVDYYEKLLRRVPATDRTILERPAVRSALIAGFSSATGKDKSHIVREYECYWNWGFTEDDFPSSVPLLIYHGKDDRLVTPELILHIAAHVESSKVHMGQGGHFAMIDMIDDMFQDVRDLLSQSAA